MECEGCNQPIDPERLAILPNVRYCVSCSKEERRIGFMDYGHKTAPGFVMLDPRDGEAVRRAKNAFRRKR